MSSASHSEADPGAHRAGPPRALGIIPTPPAVVEAMLAAAQVAPGEVVYDLGAGDGRIVITAARLFGARGVGIELDPELVAIAQEQARLAHVEHQVAFRCADLFAVDLSDADVVTLFLLPEMNNRLRPQLQRLRPGARVVSYEFDIDGCEPRESLLVNYQAGVQARLFVYQAPL